MIGRLIAAVAGAGAACVAYGTFIESAAFRVRRFDVPVLPEGAEPLRLLHVSDIHLRPGQQRKLQFLRGLAGLEPDLVVTTGDNIASPHAIEPLVAALGRLRDVPGFFVFGSNDFYAPRLKNPLAYTWRSSAGDAPDRESLPSDALRAALSGMGWLPLDEATAAITLRGTTLTLRGTSDAHEDRDDYAQVAGPVPQGTVGLGVTHAPYARVLDAMVSDGVQLVLAGHTHGGQVCVPGYGALTTNCDLPTEHARGLFEHRAGGRTGWVHVSAGIGMSPFAPYRFACPPEVSLLTLRPVTGM